MLTISQEPENPESIDEEEADGISKQTFPGSKAIITHVTSNGSPTVDNGVLIHWVRKTEGVEREKRERGGSWVKWVFGVSIWDTYERYYVKTEEWDAPKGDPEAKQNYKVETRYDDWVMVSGGEFAFGPWVNEDNLEYWDFNPAELPPLAVTITTDKESVEKSKRDFANSVGEAEYTEESNTFADLRDGSAESTQYGQPGPEESVSQDISAVMYGKTYDNNPDEFISARINGSFHLVKGTTVSPETLSQLTNINLGSLTALKPGYKYVITGIHPVKTVSVPKPVHAKDADGIPITYADYEILIRVIKDSSQ